MVRVTFFLLIVLLGLTVVDRWETEAMGDGTTKWTTLEHAGVLFPPPYEPLPKSVKMKYDGAFSPPSFPCPRHIASFI